MVPKAKLLNIILLFLFLFLLRISVLDSDPSILISTNSLADEGYWIHNSRLYSLFGQMWQDDMNDDLAVAPLYSLLQIIIFKFFGVGFFQARILSVVFSFLTLLIFFFLTQKFFSKKAAFLATFILGIHPVYLLYNRLALPETLGIFFIVLTIFFYTLNSFSLSGLSFSLAILSKISFSQFIPVIFILFITDFLKKKIGFNKLVSFLLGFTCIFVPYHQFFFRPNERAINLIFQTIGKSNFPENLWQLKSNITGFIFNPFWGNPFNFSLSLLTIIFLLKTYLVSKKTALNKLEKISFAWLFGTTISIAPLSLQGTGRYLILVLPLTWLSIRTIINKQNSFNVYTLANKFRQTSFLATFFLVIPLSLFITKIILALLKRFFHLSAEITFSLFFPVSILLIFFSIIFFSKNKKLTKFLFLFSLSIVVTILFAGLIHFVFSIKSFFSNVINFFLISVIYFCLFRWYKRRKTVSLGQTAHFLVLFFLLSCFLGLLTFYLSPGYKIKNSSQSLNKILANEKVAGIFSHHLAIQNKIYPLYFVPPSLAYFSQINKNIAHYQPQYLIIPKIIDNIDATNYEQQLLSQNYFQKAQYFTTINWDRKFLNFIYRTRLDIYQKP